jgi:hypothetical protein
MVAHTVTAGPGRTDRALDTARPFPALRASGSGSARPLQGGQRTAEPRRASALLGMLVQPVQGRGVPRPSPCGAAAPRDVYRPPRRSQRHRDQRPTRGLPALPGRRGRQRLTPTAWAGRPPVANGCPTGDAPPTPVGARRCRARPRHRRGKHGGFQPWALTIPVTRSPPRPPWIPGSPGPAGQAAPDPEVMEYRVLDDRCGVGVQRRGTSSGRGGRYGVSPVGARRGAPCGAVDPRGMHLTGRERKTGAVLVGHLAGLLGAAAFPSARAPAWGCCARSTGWQTAILAQC